MRRPSYSLVPIHAESSLPKPGPPNSLSNAIINVKKKQNKKEISLHP